MSKPPDPATLEGVLALLRHPARTAIKKRTDSTDTQADSAVLGANKSVSVRTDAVLTPADTAPPAVSNRQYTVSARTDSPNSVPNANSVLPSVLSVQSGEGADAGTEQGASKPPTLPPVTLLATPLESARARLAEYRATYGAQLPAAWLEHAKRAVEAVRATFPPERRPYALTNYLARNCEGQPAQVIAAHVIALELWAADKRQRQNGVWLDAAYQAVGLDPDALAGGAGEAARPNTPWEELI